MRFWWVAEPPKILHYGLLWTVNTPAKYQFDKHWFYDFQATKCPPWNDLHKAKPRGGLFKHPPRASEFTTKVRKPQWLSNALQQTRTCSCRSCSSL